MNPSLLLPQPSRLGSIRGFPLWWATGVLCVFLYQPSSRSVTLQKSCMTCFHEILGRNNGKPAQRRGRRDSQVQGHIEFSAELHWFLSKATEVNKKQFKSSAWNDVLLPWDSLWETWLPKQPHVCLCCGNQLPLQELRPCFQVVPVQ